MLFRDRKLPRGFTRIATAGILFQGGQASVDANTIVAALVHGLTGSPMAVGAAAAISRYGWLFPQLFVAYIAQRRSRRLPLYKIGAFGRAACLAVIGILLVIGANADTTVVAALFFGLWTIYAFVSGVLAVPYNDIVARVIPSSHRSRLLAVRFFIGGLLALAVAVVAHQVVAMLSFSAAFAAMFLLGGALLIGSALVFVSAGEPQAPAASQTPAGFGSFLRDGLEVAISDRRFRLFLAARWFGGVTAMALPAYILQLNSIDGIGRGVGIFLGAQTAGALISNPLCGWWGDRKGKLSLLAVTAAAGVGAPALAVGWLVFGDGSGAQVLFMIVFFLLGAVGNGESIATLGYLMEISPDERRPAYSGYFNALAAPAALFPLVAAALVEFSSYTVLFATCAGAAFGQVWTIGRLRGTSR